MEGFDQWLLVVYFKYACRTLSDVERSISRYKYILADNRRQLDDEYIKTSFGGSMQQMYKYESIINY